MCRIVGFVDFNFNNFYSLEETIASMRDILIHGGPDDKALNFSGFKDVEVYKLDFPFIALFPYLEKKLFGNFDKLKIKLKGIVLGDERKARGYAVEELVEVSPSKGKAYILMMLKLIRNAILLPFALGYVGKLKENGINLYFQAKA